MKRITSVLLALVATLGFNIHVTKNVEIVNMFCGNDLSYVLVFCAFIVLIYKSLHCTNKRLNTISLILSLILSVFEIVGCSISKYGNLSGIMEDKSVIIQNILKFMEYMILINATIKISYNYLDNLSLKKEIKKIKIFDNNILSIIIVACILILFWMPYFLFYYPGIIGFDTFNQLEQATGLIDLSKHHPIFLTILMKIIIDVTNPLFNNYSTSIAICVILKMIIMSISLSFSLSYLAKKDVNIKIRLFLLFIFSLVSIFSLYAVSLDKDSLFACIILIDTIILYEFVTNTEEFLKSKKKLIFAMICIILTTLIRNNGIYIFLLTVPFIYIFLRKKYIKLTVFITSTLVLMYIVNKIILSVFVVGPVSIAELFSIPVQAIARIAKYNDNNVSEKEKEELRFYVQYDKMADVYMPNLSDNEKALLNISYVKEHKIKFVILNLKMFFKYPSYYIESVLCNTSGYWYPEDIKLIFDRRIVDNKLGISTSSKIETNFIFQYIDWFSEKRSIPVVGMLFSCGFTFWMFLYIIFYIIYKKAYKLLIPQLIVFINFLIIIAGPSNTEFRYIIPMYLTLPFIYCITIKELKINNNVKKLEEKNN